MSVAAVLRLFLALPLGEQRGDKGRTHSKCQEEKYLKRLFKNSVVGAHASGWILHTPNYTTTELLGPLRQIRQIFPSNPSNPSKSQSSPGPSVKSVKTMELLGPLRQIRQIRQNHGAPRAPTTPLYYALDCPVRLMTSH